MRIVQPSAVLEGATPDALQVIERAGRTCYKSEAAITPESATALIRHVIKRGHESVLEHASASWRFVCDRGVTHELVRHRLCAYSQESTRYCNYGAEKFGGEISVICPSDISVRGGECYKIWLRATESAEEAYLALLREGRPPQIARSVLPTCLKTEIVATANFREWRHILRLRTAKDAHPQIREIMLPVLAWFREAYPVIVEDILQPEKKGLE